MAFRLKNRIMPKYKFINIKSVYSHMRLFFKNNYRRRLTLFILQNKRLRYKVRSAEIIYFNDNGNTKIDKRNCAKNMIQPFLNLRVYVKPYGGRVLIIITSPKIKNIVVIFFDVT